MICCVERLLFGNSIFGESLVFFSGGEEEARLMGMI
jgi:hypothetical protein